MELRSSKNNSWLSSRIPGRSNGNFSLTDPVRLVNRRFALALHGDEALRFLNYPGKITGSKVANDDKLNMLALYW
jgi:hypothetical protein